MRRGHPQVGRMPGGATSDPSLSSLWRISGSMGPVMPLKTPLSGFSPEIGHVSETQGAQSLSSTLDTQN